LRSGERATLRIDGRLRALDEVSAASVERLLEDCCGGQAPAMGSLDRALHLDGVGRFRVHV
jgi:Tfp pilus assembly pilus retraction ATPase PilT